MQCTAPRREKHFSTIYVITKAATAINKEVDKNKYWLLNTKVTPSK